MGTLCCWKHCRARELKRSRHAGRPCSSGLCAGEPSSKEGRTGAPLERGCASRARVGQRPHRNWGGKAHLVRCVCSGVARSRAHDSCHGARSAACAVVLAARLVRAWAGLQVGVVVDRSSAHWQTVVDVVDRNSKNKTRRWLTSRRGWGGHTDAPAVERRNGVHTIAYIHAHGCTSIHAHVDQFYQPVACAASAEGGGVHAYICTCTWMCCVLRAQPAAQSAERASGQPAGCAATLLDV